jgi:hypothetical protein
MIVRHNAIRNVVFESARQAAMAPKVEVCVIPGSQERHADLLLPGTVGTVCDFAVTHSLQKKYRDGVAKTGPSFAVEQYAESVKGPHRERVEAQGYEYAPCVVDVFGNWSKSGREVLASVARGLSARDARSAQEHLRGIYQRCSVVLTLWNMRAILSRWNPEFAVSDGVPGCAVGVETLETAQEVLQNTTQGQSYAVEGDLYPT